MSEGKSDLRIIKTRKALYTAFTMLLGEKSFEDITVNELCEKAMVRRATFYKHFADKYDFFAFFVRDTREEFSLEFPAVVTKENLNDYLLSLIQHALHYFKDNQAIIRNVLNSNALLSLVDIFSEEMYRDILLRLNEINQGEPSSATPNKSLAAFYSGGIVRLLRLWLTNSSEITELKMLADFQEILNAFSPLP